MATPMKRLMPRCASLQFNRPQKGRATISCEDYRALARDDSGQHRKGNTIGGGGASIVYWPTLIDSQRISETLHFDGETIDVLPTQRLGLPEIYYQSMPVQLASVPEGPLVDIPFGRLFGTRSGDKGGQPTAAFGQGGDEAYAFLHEFLTVEKLKALCPDIAQFNIDRYELPNIRSLNFYIHDILGEGSHPITASTARQNPLVSI